MLRAIFGIPDEITTPTERKVAAEKRQDRVLVHNARKHGVSREDELLIVYRRANGILRRP